MAGESVDVVARSIAGGSLAISLVSLGVQVAAHWRGRRRTTVEVSEHSLAINGHALAGPIITVRHRGDPVTIEGIALVPVLRDVFSEVKLVNLRDGFERAVGPQAELTRVMIDGPPQYLTDGMALTWYYTAWAELRGSGPTFCDAVPTVRLSTGKALRGKTFRVPVRTVTVPSAETSSDGAG